MRTSIARAWGLSVAPGFAIAASALATDLTRQYRVTLDFSEQSQSYEWTSGSQDVWQLKKFDDALGDGFRLSLGPSCHI